MKYLFLLLTVATMALSPAVLAEEASPSQPSVETGAVSESNDTALADLCNTYAEEDNVAADKKAAYLKECMTSMTDLSEGMQEGLPLASDETGEAVAAPSSAQVNSSPDLLVQSELVETPDPAAEQLSAGK